MQCREPVASENNLPHCPLSFTGWTWLDMCIARLVGASILVIPCPPTSAHDRGTIAMATCVRQFASRKSLQLLAAPTLVSPWGRDMLGLNLAQRKFVDTIPNYTSVILYHLLHMFTIFTYFYHIYQDITAGAGWATQMQLAKMPGSSTTWIKPMPKPCWATPPSGSLRTSHWKSQIKCRQVEYK